MSKPIEDYSTEELQSIWNGIAACFEAKTGLSLSIRHRFGFLQLSRETARRGLELGSGKRGEIILQKAKEPYPLVVK